MIGPNVIQAIIDNTGNNWMGFPFLFALCTLASMVIWFGVDIKKGRADALAWAEEIKREHGEIVGDEDSTGAPKRAGTKTSEMGSD
jgi:hypothetical protein